ncbi:MAG TPA: hypothetical protein VK204_00620 [Nocardioidaceae bacterium]|nr:hypothetical protein [Nocardioidaceae bacterium]
MTRRTWRSRLLLLPLALAMAAAVSSTPATGAVPIPPGPGDASVSQFQGNAATPHPVRGRRIPQHPFLAANDRNSMHNDAYASDAYTGPGPLGRKLRLTSATYGVEECATMAFDRRGRIEALCGGAEGSRLMLLDPETLDIIAAHPLPARKVNPEKSPLEDICAGAYFYLDHRDRAVIATTNAQIWVVGQSGSPAGVGFELLRQYDLSAQVPDGDCLVALLPDWHGLIWFVTQEGGVGTVNPRNGRVQSLRLKGEKIVNSFATDETGGMFIVSDHAMYRFDRGRRGRPRVTWRRTYDRGSKQKPGQLSQGSGTTPTLVGRDLVVVTDNADPRMRVVAFKRTAEHRRHRQVCAQPVFRRGRSATENSIVAVGRAVLVENNYGYTGPASTMNGKSTARGIARVDLGRHGCSVRWTAREAAPTSVPKASLANGLLYVYAKPAGDRADPWYFTAIDVATGRTVWRRLTGTGPQWNNHYAAIYLGPDGSAYVATLAGVLRLQDGS